MPYSQNVISLTFGGSLADGNEIWSCGVHAAVPGDSAGTTTAFNDIGSDMISLRNLIQTMIANPALLVPSGVDLEWVKVALLGPDGKYVGLPHEIQATQSGSQAGPYIPQAAVVNTLVSSVWRGAGKYNRFYLPVSTHAFPDGWGLTTFAAAAYCDEMVEFMEDVNTYLDSVSSGTPAVLSVASATRTGSVEPILEVRIGTVIDTQRRRRNNLPENYQTRAIGPE